MPPSNLRAELLDAIAADLASNEARLVYADFLQSQKSAIDQERGRLIALQCAPQTPYIRQQVAQILAELPKLLRYDLKQNVRPELLPLVAYERGFLATMTLPVEDWRALRESIVKLHPPIGGLTITNQNLRMHPAFTPEDRPFLSTLGKFGLDESYSYGQLIDSFFRELSDTPPRWQSLTLSGSLAEASNWVERSSVALPSLTELALHTRPVVALGRFWPWMGKLKSLMLSRIILDVAGIRAIPATVERLGLTECVLDENLVGSLGLSSNTMTGLAEYFLDRLPALKELRLMGYTDTFYGIQDHPRVQSRQVNFLSQTVPQRR